MRDTIQLRCDECGHVHHYNSHFIEGVLKGMKKHKYEEVARQMQEKRGPFYDKWLAAMKVRGEQKRCKGCISFWYHDLHGGDNFCSILLKTVHPGQFSCKHFEDYDRQE